MEAKNSSTERLRFSLRQLLIAVAVSAGCLRVVHGCVMHAVNLSRVRLGMTKDEVVKLVGEPKQRMADVGAGGTWLYGEPDELWFMRHIQFDENDKVDFIYSD